ncbi:hypothetical protein CQW23_32267 [Capsicum baccatum]|uniref:FHA domain-containing protein n=1 Tax=Capsicum baccatum TaxID=33114 RepID=A0A2G2V5A7_CAPBA|nr:hypothetical protein CQW23_32267 [Capsicum baccatum]
MLPSENSKELHSTDQPEHEAGNVADQKVNDTADEKSEATANGKIEAAADEKVDAAADGKGDAAVDGGVFTPAPVGKYFFVFYFLSHTLQKARLLIVCGHDQHQGKWVALLDRKGSGHVQVNGKTISKYSSCFLNSGDEVFLSQAENNAYIVQLLLESPSDVGTSAGKGKLLTIENQVEDALAIARALDLSLDGLELDSSANIGSNNAADFELSIELSSKSAAVMEKLYAAIIDGQNIEVSFDDFPYYLRLSMSEYVVSLDQPLLDIFPHKVAVYFFMFSLLMVATGFVSICKAALLSLKMVTVVNFSIVSIGASDGLVVLRPVSEINSATYFL